MSKCSVPERDPVLQKIKGEGTKVLTKANRIRENKGASYRVSYSCL